MGAVAWWGLRAYSRASRGMKAVRIRRTSDNAEQDFRTLDNGSLDVASIATFIAATTGKIVTLYDQTGNARDVTQATAGNQPDYIASGIGSLPVMRLNGTDRYLASSSSLPSTSQPFTIGFVAKHNSADTDGNQAILALGTNLQCGLFSSANQAWMYDTAFLPTATAAEDIFHAVQNVFNGTSSDINVDGSVNTKTMGTSASPSGTATLGQNSTAAAWFAGDVTEIGMWPVGFTSIQSSSMDANQSAYWGF